MLLIFAVTYYILGIYILFYYICKDHKRYRKYPISYKIILILIVPLMYPIMLPSYWWGNREGRESTNE